MQEEIKEILDKFDKVLKNYELDKKFGQMSVDSICHLFPSEMIAIKDYITNLQEELEELREDNYAYHQLMKMQNEREYRSKFLKEFQEEFGKNVFPDYDEIYKRYDKLKEDIEYEQHCNEQLRKTITNLEYKIERLKNELKEK